MNTNKTSKENKVDPPTWEELSDHLLKISPPTPEPKITLYRDNNGWCPFCERVWLTLEIKGILYKESKVSLFNPPAWYKEMVPSGRVPALMLHDEKGSLEEEKMNEAPTLPQRRLLWESTEICKELDELYPSTPKLVHDHLPEYNAAVVLLDDLQKAGRKYGGVNFSGIKEGETQEKKTFLGKLDELEALIAKNKGPFIFGSDVSGLDVRMVPWLERWRFFSPLRANASVTEGRPYLEKWYEEGIYKLAPYVNRVGGDQYSVAASSSYFLRSFGEKGKDGKLSTKTKMAIKENDENSDRLLQEFLEKKTGSLYTGLNVSPKEFARRAAAKIISNHDNIIVDCTNLQPKTQPELDRAKSTESADTALRAVVSTLLNNEEEIVTPLFDTIEESIDAAQAMKTIAQRLCVPRDMGAPSATTLRRVLLKTADGIEKLNAC